VHDEERIWRPSLVADGLKENVKTKFRETLEKCLVGQSLTSDKEKEDVVLDWLKGSTTIFFD
jgi:hypothetical protein